jgi:serine/threonine-protein kinase RsbW
MRAKLFEPPARADCVAKPDCLATVLALVDRYCAENEVDSESRHDLHLIVEEACINVISHAYPAGAPGPLSVQVEARVSSGRPMIEITIEDQGRPFNPLALPEPDRTLPLEDLPIGGLGVLLIRRLSDVQHYAHHPKRGNVLTIAKYLDAPEA